MPRISGTPRPSGIYVPELVVTVRLPNRPPFEVTALADSGADLTILPAEELEARGIGFMALQPTPKAARGVGGNLDVRWCPGEIHWRKWKFCERFMVGQPGGVGDALLGREDFFKRFVVRFLWSRDEPVFDVDPAN